ncbi:MAG: alanine--tRNA ligase-related protein, partial [Thermoplasmatota archaeon]
MAMDPVLAKMLDLKFFHDNGYQRRICPTCKDPFWATDHSLELCGDSNCVEYDFLGNPLTTKPLSVAEMRNAFQAFFERKGHKRVPRNPVVARWRDDIYLNIASIANYQPHVTSGEVPPPANPLVVSQPCIRLNDLANIGRSGRHFSCFEMMGHHAFNSKAWGEKYWTEECVAYGVEFLTKVLGLDG